MKRFIPLLITAIGGFILIVSFFVPGEVVPFLPEMEVWGEIVAVWFDILASIAFILGGGNLLKVHLKKVSDQAAGWGYSAVTVAAFLFTLAVGLLKVGSPPEKNTESSGSSVAPLAVEAMPVYSIPGTIPSRGDGERIPASVRSQLAERDGQLLFRGWMTNGQKSDLLDFQDTLDWQCQVERLYDMSQPPAEFENRLSYDPSHQVLLYSGVMSNEAEQHLKASADLFADPKAYLEALQSLREQATRVTTVSQVPFPSRFAIPTDHAEIVKREGSSLTIVGPMSESLLAEMSDEWIRHVHVRPFSPARREVWIDEINALGPDLSPGQVKAAHKVFNTVWSAPMLIQAVNSAGVSVPQRKTACELLAEKKAGIRDLNPMKEKGADLFLTRKQEELIKRFANDPSLTVFDLVNDPEAALSEAQVAVVEAFLHKQPTEVELRRELCFRLLAVGREEGRGLSEEQIDALLAGTREHAAWRKAVQELFRQSHRTRFPWSGAYSAPGTPFNWLYLYVFQPLTATMFAMLAFYVASAAFRAFRAKNLEATLLLGTAFIILLGRTPVAGWMWAWLPERYHGFLETFDILRLDQLTVYIMSLFNTAGNRAIMIGIALGIAATSLKILLGVDRSYLGSGDE